MSSEVEGSEGVGVQARRGWYWRSMWGQWTRWIVVVLGVFMEVEVFGGKGCVTERV